MDIPLIFQGKLNHATMRFGRFFFLRVISLYTKHVDVAAQKKEKDPLKVYNIGDNELESNHSITAMKYASYMYGGC